MIVKDLVIEILHNKIIKIHNNINLLIYTTFLDSLNIDKRFNQSYTLFRIFDIFTSFIIIIKKIFLLIIHQSYIEIKKL